MYTKVFYTAAGAALVLSTALAAPIGTHRPAFLKETSAAAVPRGQGADASDSLALAEDLLSGALKERGESSSGSSDPLSMLEGLLGGVVKRDGNLLTSPTEIVTTLIGGILKARQEELAEQIQQEAQEAVAEESPGLPGNVPGAGQSGTGSLGGVLKERQESGSPLDIVTGLLGGILKERQESGSPLDIVTGLLGGILKERQESGSPLDIITGLLGGVLKERQAGATVSKQQVQEEAKQQVHQDMTQATQSDPYSSVLGALGGVLKERQGLDSALQLPAEVLHGINIAGNDFLPRDETSEQ